MERRGEGGEREGEEGRGRGEGGGGGERRGEGKQVNNMLHLFSLNPQCNHGVS